jgi:Xaa-Pro aminopeptidase
MTKPSTHDLHADRLAKLRRELADQNVHGFVVPKADEHQGEYVAARSERLEWLSGFSGSAGMAIVLADKAAIFVDGRYTLQALDQTDTDLFEHCHLTSRPPADWIRDNIGEGNTLAYDAWLHIPTQVSRLQSACDQAGADLIALDGNPVDAAWDDQPPAPVAPAVRQENAFSGVTSSDKRHQIADILKETSANALVLSAPDSIAWLLNIRGSDVPFTPFTLSFAVLHDTGEVDWFVDPAKPEDGLSDFLGPDVRLHQPDRLGVHLDQLAKDGKTVHLDYASDPMWIMARLQAGGATIKRASDPCQLVKSQKNSVELDGIRSAHVRDGLAVCRFLAWLNGAAPKGGESEISIGDYLEKMRAENSHFRGLSFPTISGSGPNGAIVHYRVSEHSNRMLDQNSLLLVDSGAQYLDGTTDITRTIALGTPSDEMRDNFTRVLKGHIALASVRFPIGTTGSQLDTLARMPLWQAGLDYDHGTGHGVGCYLSVHEGPQRISKMPSTVALLPGMIISNEPGYYQTGAYGIRIENLVAVRAADQSGDAERAMLEFETLTLAPIDKSALNRDLLTPDEIIWLNSYHQRVLSEIGPLADAQTRAWLEVATAPLD